MEFYDKAETWEFSCGDPKFLHTNVIFQDGDNYYWSQLPKRGYLLKDPVSINQSLLQEITPVHTWPLFEEKFTICQTPDSPDVYIKQPRRIGYKGSAALSKYLLQEAHTCQPLINHPHENASRYLGGVVKADRITGLFSQRYAETLTGRLEDGHSVDNESCHEQVKPGTNHLHKLNLIHNDVHSENIMFASRHSNTPIIIDFDSCAFRGDLLPDKRGKMPEGACTAELRMTVSVLISSRKN